MEIYKKMTKFIKLCFVLCVLCSVFFLSPAFAATTYYVDVSTGADTNDGLGTGTAWKTITHAISVATTSGDIINVAAGTYNDDMGGAPAESFPITVPAGVTLQSSASPTTLAIIDSENNAASAIALNAGAVVDGFTINSDRVGQSGVVYFNAQATASNNTITAAEDSRAIFLPDAADSSTIQDNTITATVGQSSGIFSADLADSITVDGNTINAYHGIYYDNRGDNWNITGNIFIGVAYGASYGMFVKNWGGTTTISNNEIRSYGSGIFTLSHGTYNVDQCTLIANTTGINGINGGTIPTTNSIICYDPDGDTSSGTAFSGTVNVSYSNAYGVSTVGGTLGTGTMSAVALFTDSAGDDYTLAPGSPCINTGTPAGTDMGAYQVEKVAPTIDSGVLQADNSYVTVTFSEAIYDTTGGSGALETGDFAVTFTQNGGDATGATVSSLETSGGAALSGGETVVRVYLSITGNPSGVETVEIKPTNSTSIYDQYANACAAAQTTGALTLNDITAPTVTFSPLNGATDVTVSSNITITFSEAVRNIDDSALTDDNVDALITLKDTDASGSNIAFDATIDGAKKIITINPTSDFSSEQVVYVAIGTTVEDASDNAIVASNATFTAADIASPTVTFSPLDSATGVTVGSNITITFNEAVRNTDDSALSDSNVDALITLKDTDASGSNIAFDATINGGKTVITINPDSDFSSEQVVYVAIGTTVEDAADNAITAANATFTAADIVNPTVNSVSSSTNNDSYRDGEVIAVTVAFSESVTVVTTGGIPYIELETGATDRQAAYASGSPGATLTFNYTIQAGDTSNDLDYTGTGALALNGGTIKDAAGNNATLTLASPGAANSLGANKAIVIDTTDPGIDNGSLAANAYVDVTFDEAIYNTTSGSGALETTDFSLTFVQGAGTAIGASINSVTNNADGALSGGETVVRVNFSITGTASGVETVEIKPASNAIYDKAGNVATNTETTGALTLNDQLAATISSVSSSTGNDSYKAGEVIAVTVTFTENVTVVTSGGTPTITLETGATDRLASYASGSGGTTLTFNYTIQAGDTSSDLDYTGTDVLLLNGGTIKDGAGNNATLTLATPGAANSLGANKAIVVDTTDPTIESSSLMANNSYVAVNFSEAIYNTASGSGSLETTDFDLTFTQNSGSATGVTIASVKNSSGEALSGGETTVLVYLSISGTASGVETIEITPADSTSIYDVAGNAVANTETSGVKTLNDQLLPTVADVSSSTNNDSYRDGEVIAVTVAFSESVTVVTTGGIPYIELETGATDRLASYASGSGGTTLTFNYTIQAGDTSSDLDYTGTDVLLLNGGTIKDGAGNNATLTLATPGAANSLGANKAIVVDTADPGITIGTLEADNSYITVMFDEAVYNTANGSGALETSDFSLTFTQNSGNATGASIASVTNNADGALSGGETVVRVNLNITGTPSGVETVEIKPASNAIYDKAGNAAANTETTGAKTLNDELAPTVVSVTLSDSERDDTTYTSTLTVSLSAASVAGSPAQMRIAEDNAFSSNSTGWTSYSQNTTYTLSAGEGSRTVYYQLQDADSNTSTITFDAITVDTSTPTGESITLRDITSGSQLYSDELIVSVEVSGVVGNPAEMQLAQDSAFSSNQTNWLTYQSTTIFTLEAGEGTREVFLRLRDAALNVSQVYSDSIIVDTLSPQLGSIVLSDITTESTAYTNNLVVNWALANVSAEVAQIMLTELASFSGGSWQTYAASGEISLSAGDGTKTIYCKGRDAASNESNTVSTTILLDRIGPTIESLVAPQTGATTSDATPTFVWQTGSDEGSGVISYEVTINSTPITAITTLPTYTPTASLSIGVHTWEVRALDNAGNWGDYTASYTFTIASAATGGIVEDVIPVVDDQPAEETSGEATIIPTNSSFKVTFTATMDTTSVEQAFSVSPEVQGTYTWSADKKSLMFKPTTQLTRQTTYIVKITTHAKTEQGDNLNQEYSESFMTSSVVADSTVPTITLTVDDQTVIDGDYISATPTIEITVTDDTAINFSGISLLIDGVAATLTTVSTTSTSLSLRHEITNALSSESFTTHIFLVQAQDVAGNPASTEVTGLKVADSGGSAQVVGQVLVYPPTASFVPSASGAQASAASSGVTIAYTLNKDTAVSIYIISKHGVVAWTNKITAGDIGAKAGYNEVTYNGISDISQTYVPNGIYLIKIVAENKIIGSGHLVVID